MVPNISTVMRVALCALVLSLCIAPAARADVTIAISDDLCSDAVGEVTVPLQLDSDEPVRAILAKIVSLSGTVELVDDSTSCVGRAQGFSCRANAVAGGGHINVVVVSLGGQVIPAGAGTIMSLRLRLANGSCAATPDSVLAVRDAVVADPVNKPIAAELEDGRVACECRLGITDAKQVAKCQPAVADNTRSLVVGRLGVLSACGAALLKCTQTKPGDPDCEAKAKAKCSKELGKLPGATEKFVAAVEKPCGKLEHATLLSARGLDFDQIAEQCSGDFGGSVGSVDGIARCLAAQHSCRAEQLVASVMPRIQELAERFQLPLGASNCLGNLARARSSSGAPGADGKSLVACQTAIAKAGSRYVSTALGRLDGCVEKVLRCVQLKPGDARCLAKATGQCVKQIDLVLPALAEKLTSGIGKKCTMSFTTLAADEGLGLASLEGVCREVGVDGLSSLADYQTCLARQHQCLIRDLLQFGTPRADEVLRLVGDTPPSFCP